MARDIRKEHKIILQEEEAVNVDPESEQELPEATEG
jgi:hypothetical protein